jgi:hypothetical protein
MALGTEPFKTESAIRQNLMAPVFATADWDLEPCYVETFNEKDLSFYKRCGFQIAGAGEIPNGGPSFWTLIRPPFPATDGRRTEHAVNHAPGVSYVAPPC